MIAVISWMAGLLYLPRLFVYHTDKAHGSDASEMLATMERRLMKFIMRPAALVTLLTGLYLLFVPRVVTWSEGWIWVKLTAALGLFGAHGAMEGWLSAFAAGTNTKSAKFYRVANEIPTLLMIVIVVMVIVRPF